MPNYCAQQKVKIAASTFSTKAANNRQSSHHGVRQFFPGPMKSQPSSDIMCGF